MEIPEDEAKTAAFSFSLLAREINWMEILFLLLKRKVAKGSLLAREINWMEIVDISWSLWSSDKLSTR